MSLSYRLHDGQELQLMLSGIKPLAMFYEASADGTFYGIGNESDFQPYVQAGHFVQGGTSIFGSIHPKTGKAVELRYTFYALQEEAWRINAAILLQQVSIRTKQRPNEALDRMLGCLLGYSHEQNDEYISKGMYNAPRSLGV